MPMSAESRSAAGRMAVAHRYRPDDAEHIAETARAYTEAKLIDAVRNALEGPAALTPVQARRVARLLTRKASA